MNEIFDEDVWFALNNILADSNFQSSPSMSAFLKYVVDETINGRSARIKAYNIAVDALGKTVTFDPQENPAVRVLANRLRKKLKQYHCENMDSKVVITMNVGSYVPEFCFTENALTRCS